MKRNTLMGLTLLSAAILIISAGCEKKDGAVKIAATPREAIANSRSAGDKKAQLNYLIEQAKAYIAAKRGAEAGQIIEAAMTMDEWKTQELDDLAWQASAVVMDEEKRK